MSFLSEIFENFEVGKHEITCAEKKNVQDSDVRPRALLATIKKELSIILEYQGAVFNRIIMIYGYPQGILLN